MCKSWYLIFSPICILCVSPYSFFISIYYPYSRLCPPIINSYKFILPSNFNWLNFILLNFQHFFAKLKYVILHWVLTLFVYISSLYSCSIASALWKIIVAYLGQTWEKMHSKLRAVSSPGPNLGTKNLPRETLVWIVTVVRNYAKRSNTIVLGYNIV